MTNDELKLRAESFAEMATSYLDEGMVKTTAMECVKTGYVKGYVTAEEEILDRLKEIITYGDKLHLQSRHIIERIINELIK